MSRDTYTDKAHTYANKASETSIALVDRGEAAIVDALIAVMYAILATTEKTP